MADARKAKLAALRAKMDEARSTNYSAVREEAQQTSGYRRRRGVDADDEDAAGGVAKKAKHRPGGPEDESSGAAVASSEADKQTQQLLHVTAAKAQREYAKSAEKEANRRHVHQSNSTDYESQRRVYEKNERKIQMDKVQRAAYEKQKKEMGAEGFAAPANAIGRQHTPAPEAVDRAVQHLEKEAQRRAKFSRRRAHYAEDDVDAVNQRNYNFNKKLAKYFDKYTVEIKQNLERGTAL